MDNGQRTLESMSQAAWYNQWTVKKFLPYIHGDILEVGCGIGNFTNYLVKLGRVYAIDIKRSYIRETKRLVKDKAEVGFGDIEKGKYFFKKKEFECIICINVLEHIKKDSGALANLHKLLKSKGFLILLVPAHDFLFGKIDEAIGHFRRYDKQKLKEELGGTGFKVISSRRINMLGAIGWWFSSKVFSEKIVSENQIKIFNLIAPFVLPLEDLKEPMFGTSILLVAQK